MKFFEEFKTFAIKGNALDLAVGVIIGTAFGKIVTSLVNDIVMPPLGILIGGINFKDIKFVLKKAAVDGAGSVTSPEVVLGLGNFLQAILDFTIIAFAIFLIIRIINKIKKQDEEQPTQPSVASNEEKLLTEIRDLLKR